MDCGDREVYVTFGILDSLSPPVAIGKVYSKKEAQKECRNNIDWINYKDHFAMDLISGKPFYYEKMLESEADKLLNT